jgi:flavin-dependent dehydrogenase
MPMGKDHVFDVIIVGGGLAGLTAALHLTCQNINVCLIEKNKYPIHKVCGEYVSNEVIPYLASLGIDPYSAGAKRISNFEITNIKGIKIKANLPLGGFGLSRYAFDSMLYEALKEKTTVLFDTVQDIIFKENGFIVTTLEGKRITSEHVLGAFGKRSNLDKSLGREFIQEKSPWLAVKNHYNYEMGDDVVALHNFNGGYCGLSRTEENVVNACYLTTFKSFKKYGDIETFQREEISKNPFLKKFFKEATPVFKKPLTISQISFEQKNAVENHIFMIGDSAGLIHPLCGNGMAMAIRGAQIFSELYLDAKRNRPMDRKLLEEAYSNSWEKEFGLRLKTGRIIQKALMNPISSKLGFSLAKTFPSIVPKLIEKTHGNIAQ